ncbi:MAG: metal ABC transporter substrate-binding protein [Almyronema sp.]
MEPHSQLVRWVKLISLAANSRFCLLGLGAEKKAVSGGRSLPGVGLILVLGLIGGGCSQNPPPETVAESAAPEVALPQVVATTSVLCDLTQQVAASTIALTCLMQPGQDAHTYQAKPADRQALDQADLVLYGGYNADPAVIGLVEASRQPGPKVAVYEAAVPHPLSGNADHGHGHGEATGHDPHEVPHDKPDVAKSGGVADPHIWHDATHNAAIVAVIAEQLVAINPEQATFYQAQANQLTEQFAALDRWIAAQVATVPLSDRQLVTTHDSFRYFADAYDFEVAGALSGLSTEQKPAAGDLIALVDQVKATQVPVIFAETTTSPKLIATVAQNAGVTVAEQPLFVEGPGGAESAARTTQAMLVVNTCTIVQGLGGTCDPAAAPL